MVENWRLVLLAVSLLFFGKIAAQPSANAFFSKKRVKMTGKLAGGRLF